MLFDLGNTLIRYYERHEFAGILSEALEGVANYLQAEGLCDVLPSEVAARAKREDYEAPDRRVRPLEGRLSRIFVLSNTVQAGHADELCKRFMRPIFARAVVYPDTVVTLADLKASGIRMAIVSNTPWGSPSCLWRKEIARHGLEAYVEEIVFCRDVGWRKPARQIFDYALAKLRARADECLFVGDDPRWDLVGPRGVGIDAVLVDRSGAKRSDPTTISDLRGLLQWL